MTTNDPNCNISQPAPLLGGSSVWAHSVGAACHSIGGKKLHTFGIPAKVALHLKYKEDLAWWRVEHCYLCSEQGFPMGSAPSEHSACHGTPLVYAGPGTASDLALHFPWHYICSLCNSKICAGHAVLNIAEADKASVGLTMDRLSMVGSFVGECLSPPPSPALSPPPHHTPPP